MAGCKPINLAVSGAVSATVSWFLCGNPLRTHGGRRLRTRPVSPALGFQDIQSALPSRSFGSSFRPRQVSRQAASMPRLPGRNEVLPNKNSSWDSRAGRSLGQWRWRASWLFPIRERRLNTLVPPPVSESLEAFDRLRDSYGHRSCFPADVPLGALEVQARYGRVAPQLPVGNHVASVAGDCIRPETDAESPFL